MPDASLISLKLYARAGVQVDLSNLVSLQPIDLACGPWQGPGFTLSQAENFVMYASKVETGIPCRTEGSLSLGSGIEFRLTLLVAGDGVAKVEQETLACVDMGTGIVSRSTRAASAPVGLHCLLFLLLCIDLIMGGYCLQLLFY